MNTIDGLYGGVDPRDLPIYSIADTARYLTMPPTTLRAWVLGQYYRSGSFDPVIRISDPERRRLSFKNVCEAHVCNALRTKHGISVQRTRRAISVLRDLFPESEHPLIEHEFATSGLELFVDHVGRQILNLTKGGQAEIRSFLGLYLRRVEFDHDGIAGKLFPFTRTSPGDDDPRIVALNPRIHFGKPVIDSTRIRTAIVYERWAAGESAGELAEDYGRSVTDIEEALRCENLGRKAA